MIECRHGWVPEGGTCMFCQIADLKKQLAAEQAKSAKWESIAANEQYKWGLECGEHQELIEKFNQQQATIAAMQGALETIVSMVAMLAEEANDTEGEILCLAMEALSNTAGAEYSRVKKLEEALRLVLSRYHKLDSNTVKTIHEALGEGKADA